MKDIQGYEGLYQVSEDGQIFSLDRYFIRHGYPVYLKGQKITQTLNSQGYYEVKLCKNGKGRTTRVHRIYAIAYLPNPSGRPHINHINGIKTDNRLENLEWCSHLENMRHALNTGLIKRPNGKDHWATKKVVDRLTGRVFDSVNELCRITGENRNTVVSWLCGSRRNKSTYQYLDK